MPQQRASSRGMPRQRLSEGAASEGSTTWASSRGMPHQRLSEGAASEGSAAWHVDVSLNVTYKQNLNS